MQRSGFRRGMLMMSAHEAKRPNLALICDQNTSILEVVYDHLGLAPSPGCSLLDYLTPGTAGACAAYFTTAQAVDSPCTVSLLRPGKKPLPFRLAVNAVGDRFILLGMPPDTSAGVYLREMLVLSSVLANKSLATLKSQLSRAHAELARNDGLYQAIDRLHEELAALQGELAQKNSVLVTLSLMDELTGLYNRRGFLALAQQQFKQAKRSKKGLYLLYADLDDFKSINDQLGHETGDAALADTARCFKEIFRDSDIVARIGGDEFVVLAIEALHNSAEVLTRRLERKLAEFNAAAGRPYTLSMSIGVVWYDPRTPCDVNELIHQADTLMYTHKKNKHRG